MKGEDEPLICVYQYQKHKRGHIKGVRTKLNLNMGEQNCP